MGNWLSGLSTALTAGTGGVASYLEGQQRGRKEADDRAKELAAALRQKRLDEQNTLMQNAQMSKLMQPVAMPEVSEGAAIFQDGKWVIPSPKQIKKAAPVTRNTATGLQQWDEDAGKWDVVRDEGGKPVMPFEPRPGITYLQGMGPTGPEFFSAPTRQGAGGPTGTGVSPVPAQGRGMVQGGLKVQSELRNANARLRNLDNALDQVDANPSAFGLKNKFPKVARERLPWRDNAVDATSIGSLEYVIGDLRKDRFGGALTPLEAKKAEAIFSDPSSPSAVITAQLNVIRKAVAAQQADVQRQSETMGGGGGGNNGASGRTVSRADYNALVLANGQKAADELLRSSNARVAP